MLPVDILGQGMKSCHSDNSAQYKLAHRISVAKCTVSDLRGCRFIEHYKSYVVLSGLGHVGGDTDIGTTVYEQP